MKQLIFSLFILLFIGLDVCAQNTSLDELLISPQPSPEQVDVFVNYPEYSALIIRSSIPNLILDSNLGIIEDLSEPGTGTYRIILNPGTQIITVRAQGYIQEQFRLTSLTEPREVTYYSVEPSDVTLAQGTGNLNLVSSPSNAQIRLQGLPDFEGQTPFSFEGYAAQTYQATITKENYAPKRVALRVVEGETNSQIVELEPLFGLVGLDVRNSSGNTISSASVQYVNRTPILSESTSEYQALASGTIQIQVGAPGYRSQNLDITLENGQIIDDEIILITEQEANALPGRLTIYSDPESQIFFDGIRAGEGQASIERDAGSIRVRIVHPSGIEEQTLFIQPETTVEQYLSVLPSRGSTIARGIIFPGLGHISTNRTRGWAYLVGALGAGGYAFTQWQSYNDNQGLMDDALATYNAARTEQSALTARNEVLSLQQKRNDAFSAFQATAAAAAGIYLISVIDNFVSEPQYGYRQNLDVSISPQLSNMNQTPTPSVTLTLNF
jgi:hypothetical protein